ncbi:NAD(P)H-dependent oxidoreductase [Fusobacterium sp.]|uniref:NAD(P)H-dependent oxidoreductase n=1 Tax=Fusobacterium sp. TaxID=68766 RepID=UPI0029021BE4|nr:NAD(P)H-dependent oxidoreductase [Fusobacterium sp.]MDU1911792.1 NAD(P)H-dependent oxidoreductase [Fusobacterium sp.]
MRKLSLLFLIAALSIPTFSKEKTDDKAGASVTESKKVDMENIDAVTSASIVPAAIIKEYIPKGFTESKNKKALFVVGDPRKNSVTFDMAYTAMRFFEENGIEVTIRDLYKMKWNPVLTLNEFYYQKDGIGKPSKDVSEEQRLITQADYIIFVYPNWHDSATSIIKGYQERVFAKEFAYTADANGLRGLLKGKSLFTIMNCGFLGGGRGFIGNGVGISDEKWNAYMKAYKVFDDDLADWWGMDNYGRFMNDRYPKNLSENYSKEIEKLREDLNSSLQKTFIDKK